jgi:hypothetical protein
LNAAGDFQIVDGRAYRRTMSSDGYPARVAAGTRSGHIQRPPPDAHEKVLQRAADIRHQTLTEFVLGSAYDRAMTTLPVRVATAGPRHEDRLGR